jgi:hypothetical protein
VVSRLRGTGRRICAMSNNPRSGGSADRRASRHPVLLPI